MKTIINIKTEKKIKDEAQRIAKEMGLPLGTILNGYLRQFIEIKEAHFYAEPKKMTKKLEKRLGKIEGDIRLGRNLSPTFGNMDEAIKYLHSKK